jgi:hypothetical protein
MTQSKLFSAEAPNIYPPTMHTSPATVIPIPPNPSVKSPGYRNLALIMGLGMFASTFAQTGVLGLYPFKFLLISTLSFH